MGKFNFSALLVLLAISLPLRSNANGSCNDELHATDVATQKWMEQQALQAREYLPGAIHIPGPAVGPFRFDVQLIEKIQKERKILEDRLDVYFSSDKEAGIAVLGFERSDPIDIFVFFDALNAAFDSGRFSVLDPRIMDTLLKFEENFYDQYPINRTKTLNSEGKILGVGFGRYLDGMGSHGKLGPTFSATEEIAAYYFRVSAAILKSGRVEVNEKNLRFFQDLHLRVPVAPGTIIVKGTPAFDEVVLGCEEKAMQFVRRVREHTSIDGRQSEEFNRDSGYMQGTQNVANSYASFLSMLKAYHDLNYLKNERLLFHQ